MRFQLAMEWRRGAKSEERTRHWGDLGLGGPAGGLVGFEPRFVHKQIEVFALGVHLFVECCCSNAEFGITR